MHEPTDGTGAVELGEQLLQLSALLLAFEPDDLRDLSGAVEVSRERLLVSELFEPADDNSRLRMRDEPRAAIRRRLRLTRPREEIALHGELFAYYLKRLSDESGPPRERSESACFYHLSQLYNLLMPRQEWQAFQQYVSTAALVNIGAVGHRRQVELYEASIAIRTGEYERGERVLRELLDVPDLEVETRLNTLLALGQMNRNLARYQEALQHYQDLARLAEHVNNDGFRVVALLNLASVYNELEHFERALALALEGLRLATTIDDLERRAFAHYIAGLNAVYLGRYAFAEAQLASAIELFEPLAMEATLAFGYWQRGYLKLLLGDAAGSEAAFRQALARAESDGRGELVLAIDIWLDLGFLYFTLGRHAEALDGCARALVLATRLRHEQRLGLIHALRGRVLRALGRGEEALAAYHRALASIEKLRDAQADDDVKISVLGTAQQVYEQAVLLCLELGRAEEAFAMAERARARAFLDLLARRSPELFEEHQEPVASAAELCAALPPGAVLLAYYTTGVLPPGEHLIHGLKQGNPALFAQLTPPASTVVFVVWREGVIARELKLDPNLLRPAPGELRPSRRWLQPARLRALHRGLIAPLADLLAGREQLYIIPHGPLHHVPWLALQGPDGRHLLDSGGPAVARAPSATVLARSCLARPAGRGEGLLALGYNDPAAGLRQAEAEARAIARAIGGAALTGPTPKAASLSVAAANVRYLHLAGHAIYRPDDPLASAVVVAEGEELSARAVMAGIDLRADLVSLSACTSGLAQVVPGDELLGMLRAWLSAGAATVVCALWEAADIVARLVMERFYAELAAHGRPGPAFRDAIVAVRGLTGRELEQIFAGWRAEQEDGEDVALPALSAADYEAQPYADPEVWGTFMLIGRA